MNTNTDSHAANTREATRSRLLAAVADITPTILAHRDASEDGRTLAPACVEALRASPLVAMKSPREVGGAEAHPCDQMDVIEALALVDPAASWSMFITSAVTGSALAWLSDAAVNEIFAKSPAFPTMAGSLRPGGSAVRVDRGWRISGRWAWGSGVQHADYVVVPAFAADKSGVVRAVVPIAQVQLHDTWHVLGMRGTGSTDYELHDVFVPDRYTTVRGEQVRGGALFRLGMPGFVVNEHGSFAYAVARSALAHARETAAARKRGYAGGTSIADRAVFQRAIGEGEVRITATRLLMHDVIARLYDAADTGVPPPALQAESRAAAVLCTDEAIAVTNALFRYAGGSAVMQGHWLQRCLRDLYTVQSHLVVSDTSYEVYGQLRLGLRDDAPLV